ncbi:MAG: pyridoxamine 5'-phosphate oxidase-domain-containing protein [Monoraphidium minutum]|nr:MAG: pyridoxamine 5'-phosphate oxidase-domain-containing protein [Monoraphidium minutum]
MISAGALTAPLALLLLLNCCSICAGSRSFDAAEQRAPSVREFPRPPHTEYARMARWLAHASDWGTLATADAGTGLPYGGVVSVSDGAPSHPTGRLLFYLTPMDRTTQNLAGGGASALVLAEAQRGCGPTDPEDPTCAKITVIGRTRPVPPEGRDEAMQMLVARHPVMADWPEDHGFAPFELEVEEIHLLDFFGGMHVISSDDYFAASLDPAPSAA